MNWKNAEDSETVCYCMGVNKKTVISAIKNGNNTLAKIKESTKACTGNDCKTMNPSEKCCSGDINELILLYSSEAEQFSCCNSGCCV